MNESHLTEDQTLKLQGLLDIISREVAVLKKTADLIPEHISDEWIKAIDTDIHRGNLIEAFSARHSRLQDTLGDKLLPFLLQLNKEPTGTAIDNINRAERLGWINQASNWREWRTLRNQLVHEYFQDKTRLKNSVQRALLCMQELFYSADAMTTAAQKILGKH